MYSLKMTLKAFWDIRLEIGMYISVDTYEEMYLKGKDAPEIETEVKKIRNEIAKIKRKMEMPSYAYASRTFPTDEQVIEICRGYLERAKDVLKRLLGLDDVSSEEEKAARYIDSMIEKISCLTLTVGRYLEYKFELEFTETKAFIRKIQLGEDTVVAEKDKNALISAIHDLHIGEWKQSYLPEDYGCTLSEPTKWQLRIDYLGGAAPRFYDGLGIFPYNFSALCKLLEANVI